MTSYVEQSPMEFYNPKREMGYVVLKDWHNEGFNTHMVLVLL